MRAMLVLQRSLKKSLAFMHLRRFTALCAAVEALLHGGCLSLTGLGRAVPGQVAHKHKIKRICRLLANRRLHGELPLIYGSAVDLMLAATPQPTMLLGIAAERLDLTKTYQANTIKKRRVLSLFFVGKTMATCGDDRKLPIALLRGVLDDIPMLAVAAMGHA